MLTRRRAQALVGFGGAFVMGTVFAARASATSGTRSHFRSAPPATRRSYFLTTGFHMAHVLVGMLVLPAIFVVDGAGLLQSAAPRCRFRRACCTGISWMWCGSLSSPPTTSRPTWGSGDERRCRLQRSAADGRAERIAARTAFGLLGGPAAWFVQLLVGYTLASGRCFPQPASAAPRTHGRGPTRIALLIGVHGDRARRRCGRFRRLTAERQPRPVGGGRPSALHRRCGAWCLGAASVWQPC